MSETAHQFWRELCEARKVIAALLDAVDDQRVVLEEIAYGNDWGGPDRGHIAYMRSIAVDLLERGVTDRVIQ